MFKFKSFLFKPVLKLIKKCKNKISIIKKKTHQTIFLRIDIHENQNKYLKYKESKFSQLKKKTRLEKNIMQFEMFEYQ